MKFFSTTLIVSLLLILPLFALAGNNIDTISDAYRNAAGYQEASPETVPQIIGNVVQIVLSFVGVIFLILIIVAGFQWMTAGGNSEQIAAARKRMINATIGLIIVLAAYSITWFVTDVIFTDIL